MRSDNMPHRQVFQESVQQKNGIAFALICVSYLCVFVGKLFQNRIFFSKFTKNKKIQDDKRNVLNVKMKINIYKLLVKFKQALKKSVHLWLFYNTNKLI